MNRNVNRANSFQFRLSSLFGVTSGLSVLFTLLGALGTPPSQIVSSLLLFSGIGLGMIGLLELVSPAQHRGFLRRTKRPG